MTDPTDRNEQIWLSEQNAVLLESLATGATPDLIDGQLLVTLSVAITDGSGANSARLPWIAMTPGQARALIRGLAEALQRVAETHAHKAADRHTAAAAGGFAN